MTQRAAEREEYKKKKRLPAPEVPKPKNHPKGEKVWYLQHRYTKESWEKMLAEDKRREEEWKKEPKIRMRGEPWYWTMGRNNEWLKEGKYYDKEAAEVVMNQNLRLQKGRNGWFEHEYRIVHKDYLKHEKEREMMMKATEEVLKKDWDKPEEDKAWEKL